MQGLTRRRWLVTTTPSSVHEALAQRRAKYLTGVMWHVGAFVIINTFFVVLDAIGAAGLTWILWIIGVWGFALAFHVLAYLVDGRQVEHRKAAEYLAESKEQGVRVE